MIIIRNNAPTTELTAQELRNPSKEKADDKVHGKKKN